MWIIVKFRPITLFSLKQSCSTSSGGKGLISPTPYSFKMALLNRAIERWGLEEAKDIFNSFKDLDIRFKIPEQLVVNHCFMRIKRFEDKLKPQERLKEGKFFKSTVALRDYVYYHDILEAAINVKEKEKSVVEIIEALLPMINYLGKRGSFIQYVDHCTKEEVGDGFCQYLEDEFYHLPGTFIMQKLDDLGPRASFDNINIYSASKVREGMDRIIKTALFPVKIEKVNKSFTLYKAYKSI